MEPSRSRRAPWSSHRGLPVPRSSALDLTTGPMTRHTGGGGAAATGSTTRGGRSSLGSPVPPATGPLLTGTPSRGRSSKPSSRAATADGIPSSRNAAARLCAAPVEDPPEWPWLDEELFLQVFEAAGFGVGPLDPEELRLAEPRHGIEAVVEIRRLGARRDHLAHQGAIERLGRRARASSLLPVPGSPRTSKGRRAPSAARRAQTSSASKR